MAGLGKLIAIGLVALLAAGLVTTASSADGGSATAAAGKKKKKKTCPAGTTKKVVKKKNGKRKVSCVPNPVTPAPTPAPTTTLSISPAGVDFGSEPSQAMSGCAPFPMPDGDCPTQVFTVSNTGAVASGTPAASITDIATDPGGERAFAIVQNLCVAPLPPGGSCTITVRGAADNEFAYQSRLNVSASPGSAVSATLAID